MTPDDQSGPRQLDSFERLLAAARDTGPSLARRIQVQAVLKDVLGLDFPPPTLERYVIERKVGAGGMGVVFRGYATEDHKPVAIKVIAGNANFERARFVREAEVLRLLVSPGVVRYLDHGTTADGLDYLVTEWLDGEDLGARLRPRHPFSA